MEDEQNHFHGEGREIGIQTSNPRSYYRYYYLIVIFIFSSGSAIGGGHHHDEVDSNLKRMVDDFLINWIIIFCILIAKSQDFVILLLHRLVTCACILSEDWLIMA